MPAGAATPNPNGSRAPSIASARSSRSSLAPSNASRRSNAARSPNATPMPTKPPPGTPRLASSIPALASRRTASVPAVPKGLNNGFSSPSTPSRPPLATSIANSHRSLRTTSLQLRSPAPSQPRHRVVSSNNIPQSSKLPASSPSPAPAPVEPEQPRTSLDSSPDIPKGVSSSPASKHLNKGPTMTSTPSRNPNPSNQSLSHPNSESPSPFSRNQTLFSPEQNLPRVPWSSSGALDPKVGTPKKTQTPRVVIEATERPIGSSESPDFDGRLQALDFDEVSFDMITEADGAELDEDMQAALQQVGIIHTRKITGYKRILEQSQTSAASQLYALQAELRLLRQQLEQERTASRRLELEIANHSEKALENYSVAQVPASSPFDIISSLRGDGQGSFDEGEIRRALRALSLPDRMRLIHLILDSCLPGDITSMIRLLEKYAASAFDILNNLPTPLALNVLRYLSVPSLLRLSTVSHAWYDLVKHPSIWRWHCLQITATDPVSLRPPSDPKEWEGTYRKLHHRESNWKNGLAQELKFLKGHTGYCTTLLLRGKRLISGSYDETIRVWDIGTGEEKKCLKVKAVSCLDFLDEEEVFVAGFHDIGRVQVFSSVTWTVLQTLQGHLYGIRAVAMSSSYLVSAGADKAIVCWDWRAGTKIVRFGQQTNLNIGVQIVDDDRVVGITVDGIVRTFSIRQREMLSQFKLCDLTATDPLLSARLAHVGVGPNNMLQWFAAKGTQMTCATKNLILHLQWASGPSSGSSGSSGPAEPSSPATAGPTLSPIAARSPLARSGSSMSTPRRSLGGPASHSTHSAHSTHSYSPRRSPHSNSKSHNQHHNNTLLSQPPNLLAMIETPDVAVGAVDPRKRRVATSTRFSTRAGADRRIFVSTYVERSERGLPAPSTTAADANANGQRHGHGHGKEPTSRADSGSNSPDGPTAVADEEEIPITAIGGAWEALGEVAEEDHQSTSTPTSTAAWGGSLPAGFKGLASPAMNPMAMALSHEEVVVGCADGTIYVMNFAGYRYGLPAHARATRDGHGYGEDSEDEEEEGHQHV